MASSSMKAKVLKDDPFSFAKTGIPRGNPQRFGSSNVMRMSRDARGVAINPEEEKIETEGERQLKVLAKRQLHTQVTITEQLQRKRDFTGATIFKPLVEEVSGQLSLSDYREAAERDLRIDQLRHCGLSDSEIELKLASELVEAGDGLDEAHKFASTPKTKQAKLQMIEQKIEEKQEQLSKPTSFRGTRHMTRHEQQLEASISHDSEKTKLLSCLLTSKKPETEFHDPKHPMNNLDSIMENILGNTEEGRTGAKHSKSSSSESDHHSCEFTGVACAECSRQSTSDTNVNKTTPAYECCEECDRHQRALKKGGQAYPDWETVPSNVPIKGCSKQKPTISTDLESELSVSGDSRTLLGKVESIPEEHILKYRLSADQIRQLPRFQNYYPGEPSKTLYIKNFSPKATERDLVSLFIRYQKPESAQIVFKLMTGRMRGQAFVTFDSVETAMNALNLINGYQFKDRPIIIQYGKKQREDQT